MKPIVLLAFSLFYWGLVCRVAGVSEPWDADAYWRLCYPLSVALSAGAGLLLRTRGWMAGAIVTFAQLPVMAWNAEGGEFWAAGLLLLVLLALPAMAVSTWVGRAAARRRAR